ncbi:MAG: NADP-dependent phosphogluconate dehydrogenase, partial [Proteobacteria bacterium]|nr:NADP-dependent phosphogluconate dehydrogenase [Pseudomonadota bacterium]
MTGQADIGLVGLGTMGAALALNIAEKGFTVAVWNRHAQVTRDFAAGAGTLAARIVPAESLSALAAALKPPGMVILMVPAGPVVDEMTLALRPLLGPEGLIIDAGNANFHDTNRRMRDPAVGPFLGVGVSGGEEGARHGPSIMAGGPRPLWERAAPILTAISARHLGEPCAAWMGEEGAGHFVKAVHNGIEYADMQMIAEVYGILRDGLGMAAPGIGRLFEGWNAGPLKSYLTEITAEVAAAIDPSGGGPMLDVIRDAAGQKGTGRWTVIEAQNLAAAIPAIEAAVMARNLSARLEERRAGEALFGPAPRRLSDGLIRPEQLERALIAGKITCYAQGFAMIAAASQEFGWALDLPSIARVWREGCIIRSAMLNDMAAALAGGGGRNLMFAPFFAALLKETGPGLRHVVAEAARNGLAAPALASGLAYFDLMRTG